MRDAAPAVRHLRQQLPAHRRSAGSAVSAVRRRAAVCAAKFSVDVCCGSGADFYNGCTAATDKDPYKCLLTGVVCDEATGLMTATHACGTPDGGGDQ